MTAPTFRLMAPCPPGLEPLLLAELGELGIRASGLQGGAIWTGGWEDLMRANLHLRVASRVLVELGTFGARALGELERKGADLPWDRVPRTAPARFRVSASRSRLYHEGAIEERLRRVGDLPPAPDRDRDPAREGGNDAPEAGEPAGPLLVVRVHRDRVTVRLDTSGEHLHRRGYRRHVGIAPLRETLAAALLLAGPFPPGTLPRGSGPESPAVVDPFCGAGTVAIEAALLARRIPPGLASAERNPRDFAFLGWPDCPAADWTAAVDAARAGILPPGEAPPRIHGSDRDAGAVDAARTNAAAAGVAGDLHLAAASLSRAPLPSLPDAPGAASGWIVTNPPYGGRLGDRRRLRPLYASLGRSFLPGGTLARGWSLLYLSGDPVLDAVTGLPLEERFATTNGGLHVRAMALVNQPAASPDEAPDPAA
jgi:putative N6-adenine-specific DNA methylase